MAVVLLGVSHEGSDLDLVVRNPFDLETPIENLFTNKAVV